MLRLNLRYLIARVSFLFMLGHRSCGILLNAMELRSRVLAEVETGDTGPGVPGPSSLVTA